MSDDPRIVSVFVPGPPATKGSARAFIRGGRAVVVNDNPRCRDWAGTLALLAREQWGDVVSDHAWSIGVSIYLERPKAHTGAKGLRANAPRWPLKKPDADKVLRAALDALTGIVYRDDCQVTQVVVCKLWATETHPEGVNVVARQVTP